MATAGFVAEAHAPLTVAEPDPEKKDHERAQADGVQQLRDAGRDGLSARTASVTPGGDGQFVQVVGAGLIELGTRASESRTWAEGLRSRPCSSRR